MKPILKNLTNDQLLSHLKIIVAIERSINSEVERRALADPAWPAPIAVAAGLIYRGYIPLPAEQEERQPRFVKQRTEEQLPSISDDILSLLD